MTQTGISRAGMLIGLVLPSLSGCGIELDSSMVGALQPVSVATNEPDASSPIRQVAAHSSGKTWTAPYPQRVNPFLYPGDDIESTEAPKRETSTSHVSVVGFANVDRPVAMLRFRDESRTLGVGEQHGGIRVTDIAPPKVTLQMSNLAWTISMFDKSTR